ncbi:hypothetical protein LJJ21_004715 [Salmonella enterica]|nr:hypothetical protein [Salmonella enterica]
MNMNRSNVIPFGKPVRRAAEAVEHATHEAGERRRLKRARMRDGAKRAAAAIGTSTLATLIYVLFLVLWWLRGPVRFLLGLASGASLITLPIMWLGLDAPWKTNAMLAVAAVGFGSAVFMWFYDALLLRLSPEPIMFTN